MSAQEQKNGRWKAFTSLDWYDGTIEFLFRFVAKTSEPLLAAGIVYSAADVLSKGHLGSTSPIMDNLWAISQALAIESSGGVVLVYGLQSLKEKDRTKACLYLILSALLAITGGVMLYMQLAGLENQQPDSLLMRGLFALRCIVSVGYIYLCRTKSISFRSLDSQQTTTPTPEPATPAPTQEQPALQAIDYQRLAQELAPLLQAVRTTIIEEVKASITGPETGVVPGLPEQQESQQQNLLLSGAGKKQRQTRRSEEFALPTNERLETAYQELAQAASGKRVSGRVLANFVHIDRQTCTSWLKKAHPENMPGPHLATTASQPETEITTTDGHLPAITTASQPAIEVTSTAIQPEPTDTEPSSPAIANQPEAEPELTATDSLQPEAAAIVSGTPATIGQPQVERTAVESQPQITVTPTTGLEPTTAEPQPTATTSQPEAKQASAETATIDEPEPEATATTSKLKTKTTASTPRPRKEAGATATGEAVRSRSKATATQPASK